MSVTEGAPREFTGTVAHVGNDHIIVRANTGGFEACVKWKDVKVSPIRPCEQNTNGIVEVTNAGVTEFTPELIE